MDEPAFRAPDYLTMDELLLALGRKEAQVQSAALRMSQMEQVLEAQRKRLAQLQGTPEAPEAAPETETASVVSLPQPEPEQSELPAPDQAG